MKKYNKTYNINEAQLNQIIKNKVKKYLDDYGLLQEMAFTRKMFKEKIEHLTQQIIQNWCLINYVNITKDKTDFLNHWKIELLTHLNAIQNATIKNDSIRLRERVFDEVWFKNGYELDTNTPFIKGALYMKFENEGIYDEDIIEQVAYNFSNEVKNIANVLVGKTKLNAFQYVSSLV